MTQKTYHLWEDIMEAGGMNFTRVEDQDEQPLLDHLRMDNTGSRILNSVAEILW